MASEHRSRAQSSPEGAATGRRGLTYGDKEVPLSEQMSTARCEGKMPSCDVIVSASIHAVGTFNKNKNFSSMNYLTFTIARSEALLQSRKN
jgi:hypothetical protein